MPGARVASGECVTLRTVEREDVPFFSRSVTNPELRLPAGNTVVNQTQLESGVENDFGDDTPMVVCIDGDDAGPGPAAEANVQRIGGVSVTDEAPFRPELGVFVVPEYQGEGYGTEAVSLLIDYVFQVYHHPAVGSWSYASNEASRGLLESLGFTQEGRLRDDLYWNGQYRDRIQYGLRREEWHDRD